MKETLVECSGDQLVFFLNVWRRRSSIRVLAIGIKSSDEP